MVKTGDKVESRAGLRKKQVNVLCHGNLTPGDLEFLSESIESFGLRAMLIPDLSGSLDGHLGDDAFNPLTTGGLPVDDLKTAGESTATLVIGDSVAAAADVLSEKTGVPEHRFSHLMTLDAVDSWLQVLSEISGKSVPEKWGRHRKQLQDAMLDTHFMIGATRYGMAADPDLLTGFSALMTSMGSELVTAVIPARATSASQLPVSKVQIGDLEDLEKSAREHRAQLLVGNSHCAASAERLGLPLIRIGFPQYDLLGGFQRCWVGYRGVQNTLFELANVFMSHHKDLAPYDSIYSQKRDGIGESDKETVKAVLDV